jgi:hypothetical protein
MRCFPPSSLRRLLLAGLSLSLVPNIAWSQVSVRHVQVLGSKDAVEIEVEASDRITPETQVLAGPDRLVVDFPNAIPGNDLRSQSVYRGQVKDLRVGLFRSKPPVTRIVVDLNSAQSYQVFPGRTVIIKVLRSSDGSASAVADYPEPQPAARQGLVAANYVTGTERVQAEPAKPFDVSFRNGQLAIHANKATLSEVLYAVQQHTGAQIAIAAGAEQERIVVDLGPGPAPEVLSRLLNGSHFNFLILSAADDSRKLDRVILSPRTEGMVSDPLPPMPQNDDSASVEEPAPERVPPPVVPPAEPPTNQAPSPAIQNMQNPPAAQPEMKGDDDSPQ